MKYATVSDSSAEKIGQLRRGSAYVPLCTILNHSYILNCPFLINLFSVAGLEVCGINASLWDVFQLNSALCNSRHWKWPEVTLPPWLVWLIFFCLFTKGQLLWKVPVRAINIGSVCH